MDFYVMTEPALSGNFWNAKYMAGMRVAVRECKGKLHELQLRDLEKISAENRNTGGTVPIILNGRSPDWLISHIAHVTKIGLHPILLATYSSTTQRGVSSLSFDFYGIYTDWCQYMCKRGWRNMALLGVSHDNMSDAVKRQAFCDFNSKHNAGHRTGIYYIDDSLQSCCESFLADAEQYDAVLCTSDVISIVLANLLRQKGSTHPLRIHSFWDSPLAEYLSPEIKIISLDYHEMGRQAVRLYTFLVNNPGLESLSATVRGVSFVTPESVENANVSACKDTVLQDERAKDIYTLEQLFSSLDAIDLQIIGGVVRGIPYEQIAEQELIAVGTVKYRIKKMLTLAQKSDRKELLAMIDEYLGADNFLRSIKSYR